MERIYRRGKKSDVVHWMKTCEQWPKKDYQNMINVQGYTLCKSCQADESKSAANDPKSTGRETFGKFPSD